MTTAVVAAVDRLPIVEPGSALGDAVETDDAGAIAGLVRTGPPDPCLCRRDDDRLWPPLCPVSESEVRRQMTRSRDRRQTIISTAVRGGLCEDDDGGGGGGERRRRRSGAAAEAAAAAAAAGVSLLLLLMVGATVGWGPASGVPALHGSGGSTTAGWRPGGRPGGAVAAAAVAAGGPTGAGPAAPPASRSTLRSRARPRGRRLRRV